MAPKNSETYFDLNKNSAHRLEPKESLDKWANFTVFLIAHTVSINKTFIQS